MTSYPDTPVPPSPFFTCINDIITQLCDECLQITYSEEIDIETKMQAFSYTMQLIDYWEEVRKMEEIMCYLKKET